MTTTRRTFVSSMATLGIGGCCCKSAPPITGMNPTELAAPSNLLAPSHINTSLRLTQSVIDPHCHIFNASDVQVGGFLAKPIANQSPPGIRQLLKLLAPIIEAFANSKAISAYDEMQQLDRLENQLRSPSSFLSVTPEQVLDAEIDAHRRQLAEELAREIQRNKELSKTLGDLQANPAGFTTGNPENLQQFILDALSADEGNESATVMTENAPQEKQAGGVFTFVGHMLAPRFHNLRSYQKTYSSGTRAIGINKCFASLVDMDYWLGSCDHPVSSLRDQILLNQRLANLSNNYLVPLVGYNPWTDLAESGASLALVKDAITLRGFKGVKIYPPLGYFPHGNATNPNYPASGRRPDLNRIDQNLAVLFEECRALDVPVMAHANESLGQTQEHNVLAGPDGWRSFFNDPRNRTTRVNLAHAGGEHGGDPEVNWTAEFRKIMRKAPHLYADLGYWDNLVAGDPAAAERLKVLLNEPVGDGEVFSDRLMFGTDWFMLTRRPGFRHYAVQFQHALQNIGVDPDTLENLFANNVKRLFKI